jgi:hypothetical protein
MSYRAQIVIGRSADPVSDASMPAFRLHDEYPTAVAARDAAQTWIKAHGYEPGQAWYELLDQDGNAVADSSRTIGPTRPSRPPADIRRSS